MDSRDMSLDLPDDSGVETFLWYIYRRNRFTDVEFELQGEEGPITYSAHTLVLAIWSHKFEDMFYRGERHNLVCLKGVNPQAFEALLKFMYGCEPVLESPKDACELSRVASEFGVASLADLCQNYLLNVCVEVANVFDILDTADRLKNESMKRRCLKLIQTETKSIFTCYECSDFTPPMVKIILDSPKLSLDSEFELLLWIFAWAKNRFLEHHEYGDLRGVLYAFLPKLDFLALSNKEFATICQHHANFFTESEALTIFMNIAIEGSRPMPAWYSTNVERRVYTGMGARQK